MTKKASKRLITMKEDEALEAKVVVRMSNKAPFITSKDFWRKRKIKQGKRWSKYKH